MVPLANLVRVMRRVSAARTQPLRPARAVTITANLAPGYTMGEALKWMERRRARILPPGYAVDYDGQSREFKLSSESLALTFVLALAFIYLVLAAQFESFRDPLRHHADGAAVDDRRAAGAAADRRHAQRL
ncbi:MAG: efflux RND transporter permease subunit [Accumulibacter sp.]|jgi:multidrug efflux pump|uniref:efflux RND transporter permease subunit n=1 Tax=Accumulibacter sp. TaxID=2053492 RepID=UPI002FC2F707